MSESVPPQKKRPFPPQFEAQEDLEVSALFEVPLPEERQALFGGRTSLQAQILDGPGVNRLFAEDGPFAEQGIKPLSDALAVYMRAPRKAEGIEKGMTVFRNRLGGLISFLELPLKPEEEYTPEEQLALAQEKERVLKSVQAIAKEGNLSVIALDGKLVAMAGVELGKVTRHQGQQSINMFGRLYSAPFYRGLQLGSMINNHALDHYLQNHDVRQEPLIAGTQTPKIIESFLNRGWQAVTLGTIDRFGFDEAFSSGIQSGIKGEHGDGVWHFAFLDHPEQE